ncbi:MAG: IS200/IS605 family transposase [Anaerolineae bacterium]|nr:IS200/IS605 family transposase [Anaerolineae bacterium]
MAHWVCLYHVVWATKYRQPILTPTIEQIVYPSIRQTSDRMGCQILALNGVTDHVHVAASVPPTVLLTKWIGDMKAIASRDVNLAFPDAEERFFWQEGYSIHTFGQRSRDIVIRYIENQKQHHATNTLYAGLEHIAGE